MRRWRDASYVVAVEKAENRGKQSEKEVRRP
jgi:hypothetical protein